MNYKECIFSSLRKKKFVIVTGIFIILSVFLTLHGLVTMVSSQTQVNLEQFVQLQLLWAKLDYLHLRNKYGCLMLHI